MDHVKRHAKNSRRAGQTMTEFAIVAGMVVAMVATGALLLYVFKENGSRVLSLVSAEFP
jgi:hypothetical protein